MSGFMRWSYFLLLVGFLIHQSGCEVRRKNFDCESYGECSECLRHLGCVWCIKPNISRKTYKNDLIHCYSMDIMNTSICNIENLVDPPSTEEITSQKPLQSKQGGHVQVTPQKVKLTMRLGEEKKINFQFAQSEDYPIDLYYIMDLSASMETHREKLGNLGTELALTMRNITNNFRIGFGSFVDKVQSPFVSTMPKKLESPCRLIKKNEIVICVPPYSFKNHMSLDGNYKKFSHEVSRAKVSGNMDTPEGGFDAIMQAIVCKKQIGWRDQARHLLVFSTDADFHIAGDGRLVGVVEPNDGKCHMSHDQYDSYLNYDYPSVSHLNYIAKKNNINLIFAIVNSRYSKNMISRTYEELAKNIENSYVGALEGNSENVIKLVLENYNKIVDSVIIDVNSTDNIEVQLSSNCTTPKINGCSDIHVGEIINFTATIKPLTCTGYKGEPISIVLKPEGIDENVTIEIDLICGCDCEKRESSHFIENSEKCSKTGDLVCGVCACAPGRYGTHCECDGEQANSYNETNCIERPGALVCSGLGRCKCGICECFKSSNENEVISGKYCQCSNSSCEWDGGLLCAGNGDCSCGVCQCKAGWGGTSCNCLERNATCIREGNSAVCSGNGICSCGKCECDTDYTGKYCEECPTCKDRCEDIKNCVECTVFKSGPLKKMCNLNCNEYYIDEVDELSPTVDKKYKICRTIDDKRCTTLHRYRYDKDQNIIIEVLKKKSCPPNILVWTLGVIGTIFLAGLIMLLTWKIFTTIHDKREYVRFENERKKVKWHTNENPLYKDATTTFQNPVYKS